MALLVQKFGGSSLSNPERIKRIAQQLANQKSQNHELVVVVSAMGHMTDALLRLARRVSSRPNQREMDMLLTAGERISMTLLAMSLADLGTKAISFTGSQGGIITTGDHAHAQILRVNTQRILNELANGHIVIVAGFQGVSETKEVTTLGRGGSDTSAVALAIALQADRCEIYTDVEGICTANPKIVPQARVIRNLSHHEAMELAHLGGKMHSRSMTLARRYQKEVWIGKAHCRATQGTRVTSERRTGGLENKRGKVDMQTLEKEEVTSIATQQGFCGLKLQGRKVTQYLDQLAPLEIHPYFLQITDKELTCLFKAEHERQASEILSQLLLQTDTSAKMIPDLGTVGVVGHNVARPHILTTILREVDACQGSLFLFLTHPLSVTLAIPRKAVVPLAQQLHVHFFGASQLTEPLSGVSSELPRDAPPSAAAEEAVHSDLH